MMKLICPHCGHNFDGTPADGSAQCPKCHEFFNVQLFVVGKLLVRGKRHDMIFYSVHTSQDKAQIVVDKLTKKFGPTFLIVNAPLDP